MPLSWFNRFLLICALLLAQLGGLTHGVSHVLTGQQHSSDQSLPHDKLCDLCASYAQLGGAPGSQAVQLTFVESATEFIADSFNAFCSTTFNAFAARAPPYFA